MVSTFALVAGLLALALSVAAIALATIANRRHMAARRRSPSASHHRDQGIGPRASAQELPGQGQRSDVDDREQVLVDLRARLATAEELVGRLATTVAELEEPVSAGELRLTALTEQVAPLAAQLAGAQVDVAELNERVHHVTQRTDATAQDLDRATERLEALVEHAAMVQARTEDTLQLARSAEERGAEHAQGTRMQVDALSEQVIALREHVLSADPTALRHVAVVRYDAFADVGGRLSYSLAVLDDRDTGFVVTTLAGKAEVRTYVRAISQGLGETTLTAEEQQAIAAARLGAPNVDEQGVFRDSRRVPG